MLVRRKRKGERDKICISWQPYSNLPSFDHLYHVLYILYIYIIVEKYNSMTKTTKRWRFIQLYPSKWYRKFILANSLLYKNTLKYLNICFCKSKKSQLMIFFSIWKYSVQFIWWNKIHDKMISKTTLLHYCYNHGLDFLNNY